MRCDKGQAEAGEAVVGAVLCDPRLAKVVRQCVRDALLCRQYRALRADGVPTEAALEALRGPHADGKGGHYWLSAGRVRNVVYGPMAARV